MMETLLLRLRDGFHWDAVGTRRCSWYKSATVGISARGRAITMKMLQRGKLKWGPSSFAHGRCHVIV
jgi:hypothetical protein